MSAEEHEKAASRSPDHRRVEVAVITVSDTRTPETDRGGDRLQGLIEEAGHTVSTRLLVPDEAESIDAAIVRCLEIPSIRAVLLTGGTGISPRDGTVEVVRGHLRVELPGYGELIRRLGFDEIGAAAIMSRAVAGVARRPGVDAPTEGVVIFTMPGSVQAVESATRGAILPVLPHAVWQIAGGRPSG